MFYTVPKLISPSPQLFYNVFMESTGFVTCLLSLTRAISLCTPFYRTSGKTIVKIAAIFIGTGGKVMVIFQNLRDGYTLE